MLAIVLGCSLHLPTIPCAQEAQASKLSLHPIQPSHMPRCARTHYLWAIAGCVGAWIWRVWRGRILLNIQIPGPAPSL